jgi:hypothetical protein
MFFTEDPRLAWAKAIPATEFSRSAAPNDLEKPSNFKKDVKMEGKNQTSHLESTKVSKNELNWSQNEREKHAGDRQKSPTNHDRKELGDGSPVNRASGTYCLCWALPQRHAEFEN